MNFNRIIKLIVVIVLTFAAVFMARSVIIQNDLKETKNSPSQEASGESNSIVLITPSSQNLGKVIYGDVATTTFTLTNSTSKALKITRVSTSCGCTKAEVEKKDLGANEMTVVKVSFDPAVHKDDTDIGEVTRFIYVETDNPDFPQLTSTITANVIKEAYQ